MSRKLTVQLRVSSGVITVPVVADYWIHDAETGYTTLHIKGGDPAGDFRTAEVLSISELVDNPELCGHYVLAMKSLLGNAVLWYSENQVKTPLASDLLIHLASVVLGVSTEEAAETIGERLADLAEEES